MLRNTQTENKSLRRRNKRIDPARLVMLALVTLTGLSACGGQAGDVDAMAAYFEETAFLGPAEARCMAEELSSDFTVADLENIENAESEADVSTDLLAAGIAATSKCEEVADAESAELAASAISDVASCEIDTTTGIYTIVVTNSGAEVRSYELDVSVADASGVRLDDEYASVAAVPPGVTVSERSTSWSEGAASCEVVDGSITGAGTSDVTASCTLDEPSYDGTAAATVVATNNGPAQESFFVDVGFYNAAGERVDSATAFVVDLRPGETAQELALSDADATTVTSCEFLAAA